jgi:hypothetical protein
VITIDNGTLRLTLNPNVGGIITSIIHLPSGLSVLGEVPWDAQTRPLATFAARDEPEWLTRYTGGWPLLFPNAGDACNFNGVFHGFHGEASISPWLASTAGCTISLSRRFFTVPVLMRRTVSLSNDEVLINEDVELEGTTPIEVMWGHHATFGSDLLAGPVEITSSARHVTADDTFDPATNSIHPGATGALYAMPGKNGVADISHPAAPLAALLYLESFDVAWAAIRRLDNAVAVALAWDSERFPCAWAWLELAGTSDAPWHGRAKLIGLEPNTTRSAYGLAQAKATGGNLLRLEPNTHETTQVKLRVFRPAGPVRSYFS